MLASGHLTSANDPLVLPGGDTGIRIGPGSAHRRNKNADVFGGREWRVVEVYNHSP